MFVEKKKLFDDRRIYENSNPVRFQSLANETEVALV